MCMHTFYELDIQAAYMRWNEVKAIQFIKEHLAISLLLWGRLVLWRKKKKKKNNSSGFQSSFLFLKCKPADPLPAVH